MKKEYTLPWTCETGDKIKRGLVWVSLIISPIILATGIYFIIYKPISPIGILIIPGFLFTILSWMFVWLTDFIEFPSFKCKCDDK